MNKNICKQLLVAVGLFLTPFQLFAQTDQSFRLWTAKNSTGQDSVDVEKVFVTHQRPQTYPYMEGTPAYNVAVNHSYSAVYNDKNYWKSQVDFTSFEFEDGKDIVIDIASKNEITSFEILPKFAEVEASKTSKHSVQLKLNKANQQLTLVINDDYKGDVLHIFANSIDHDAPKIDKSKLKNGYLYDTKQKLHYFAPGYYNLSNKFANGILQVLGDRKIYLAAGAVVEGQLGITNGNGAKIYGRGMIMNAENNKIVLALGSTKKASVEGILVHGHRSPGWCTTISNSNNVTFENVKIITTRYASTDGIDISGGQDCKFENVFIRSCDDGVAIKGLADASVNPANGTANKNLFFNRMQLWNDCNNAFGLGAETRAPYENIHLTNSEVLFSYDDPYHHEQLDERSAMNICCLHGTTFKNISFENIYVNRCERLIGLGFKSSFWFGSIQGDQSYPGEISGVTFKNITSPNNSGSTIANQIHLYGWEATDGTTPKKVTNITFDNVLIEGKLLNNENDAHIVKNSMVDNLHFTQTDGIHTAQSHNEVVSLSTAQGTPFLLEGRGPSPAWTLYSYEGSALKRGNGAEVPTIGLPRAHYLLRVATADGNAQTFKVTVK